VQSSISHKKIIPSVSQIKALVRNPLPAKANYEQIDLSTIDSNVAKNESVIPSRI